MWTTNKRDRCLRTILLFINCVACVTVIYTYIAYVGNQEKRNENFVKNFIQPEKLTSKNCTPVCDTSACVWHANMFLKNIDSSADPCEDILSFACGGYRERFGPHETGSVLMETHNFLINKLKGILENVQAKPESASAKMKTVYDSCINYGSSELQGFKELKNFLTTIGISNWPNFAQDFNFSDISLPILLGNFIAFNTEEIFSLTRSTCDEFQEQQQNVEKNCLWVFFNGLFGNFLPRELAVTMLKYFEPKEKDIDMVIEDYNLVMNSVRELHKQNTDFERSFNYSDAYIRCPRQNEDDWHDFCETMEFFLNSTITNKSINTSVIVVSKFQRTFLPKVFSRLKTFPKRTLANFIVLNFIRGYQAELNFYFRLHKLKHKDFEWRLDEEFYELDRRKFCIRWIVRNMQLSMTNEFHHQYLSSSITEELFDCYKNYSSEVMNLVTFQEWIPSNLKLEILEWMGNASFNLNVLSQLFPDDSFVDKFYEKFLPSRKSFFSNVLQLKILSKGTESTDFTLMELISRKTTKFEVQSSAAKNFAIHYGMLLPPFHVPGYNRLMNRIMLTSVMVHELGHFIHLILEDSIDDNEVLLEKRKCLSDQFSRFKFENLNEYLNGSQYDVENFPDSVATTVIDKVIEEYSSSQITLPGLPFSTKQLLYMVSVQAMCAKSNLKVDLFFKTDSHAPSEFRLMGMMQNSRGYPEAFQCPDGSYMNPETKCSILDIT